MTSTTNTTNYSPETFAELCDLFARDGVTKLAIADALFSVHPTKRADYQSVALAHVMAGAVAGTYPLDAIVQLNDVFGNLDTYRTSAGTRTRTKQTVPNHVVVGRQLVALNIALQHVMADVSLDDANAAEEWADAFMANTDPSGDDIERYDSVVEKVVAALGRTYRRNNVPSGPKQRYDETVADLVNRGAIKAGDKLTSSYGSHAATVRADGTLRVKGHDYATPNAAAVKGAGIQSAVNGWAFWMVGTGDAKVTIGSLRTH